MNATLPYWQTRAHGEAVVTLLSLYDHLADAELSWDLPRADRTGGDGASLVWQLS